MDKLVNIETGQIEWEEIKKLREEERKTDNFIKKFYCKKCDTCFYSKSYHGDFPLCFKHRNNTFKTN